MHMEYVLICFGRMSLIKVTNQTVMGHELTLLCGETIYGSYVTYGHNKI